MRIGIFTDTYKPEINGVVTSIEAFKTQLEKIGHEVLIFAPNSKVSYSHFWGSKIWRFPSLRFYGFKQTRIVLPVLPEKGKHFFKMHFDVIHTQTPAMMGIFGVQVGKHSKTPLIHTYHTFLEEYVHYLHLPETIMKEFAVWATKKFIQKHNFVICPSRGMKNILLSYGVERPIRIIPTGIDIEKTEHSANLKSSQKIFKNLNLSDSDIFLITASRLGREKNLEFLLKSMVFIVKKFPVIKLIIAGDGPAKNELIQMVQNLGLEKNIIFTGFLNQPELFALYKKAKAFIFASLTETQGLVALEAMALNIPVVALKAMGIEDLIGANQGGYLLDHKEELLAQKTIELINNQNLWQEKSREAKTRAQEFSIQNTTRDLVDLYLQAIESKKQSVL